MPDLILLRSRSRHIGLAVGEGYTLLVESESVDSVNMLENLSGVREKCTDYYSQKVTHKVAVGVAIMPNGNINGRTQGCLWNVDMPGKFYE